MTDPHRYLDEIRDSYKRIQEAGKVSPTENALFGMIDGTAGMLRVALERITKLERQVAHLKRAAATPAEAADTPARPAEPLTREQPAATN